MTVLFSQPSHSDKAANPEVLKWTNDLAKFRKQLKGEQPPLVHLRGGSWTLPHLNWMLGSVPVTVTFLKKQNPSPCPKCPCLESKLKISEEDLGPVVRQRSNTLPKSFGSQLEKDDDKKQDLSDKSAKPAVEATLDSIQKKLQEKRTETNRPEDIKVQCRQIRFRPFKYK